MTTKEKMLLFSYQTEALSILKKWREQKENKDLDKLIRAFDIMYHYQILLEHNVKDFEFMLSELREKKNKEILELKEYGR